MKNAFEVAPKRLKSLCGMIEDINILLPPQFFKLGNVEELDVAQVTTKIIVINLPVNLVQMVVPLTFALYPR